MPVHVAGRRLLRPAEVERRWSVRLTDGTVRYELAAVEAFERALAGEQP
jgi:hypothetical protein